MAGDDLGQRPGLALARRRYIQDVLLHRDPQGVPVVGAGHEHRGLRGAQQPLAAEQGRAGPAGAAGRGQPSPTAATARTPSRGRGPGCSRSRARSRMTRTRCRGSCRLGRTAHTTNTTTTTAAAMTARAGRPSRASHRTPARTASAATITQSRVGTGPPRFPGRWSSHRSSSFLAWRALVPGAGGLQAADIPDQLAAGRPGAVADLGGHRTGQLGHLGQRHRRQVAALPGQLDHLVPFRRATIARTRRPGFSPCPGACPGRPVRGAEVRGQLIAFGLQPGGRLL